MTHNQITEAQEIVAQAQCLLDQARDLADDALNPELTAASQALEDLEAALYYTEPQPDSQPIADTVRERYL